MKNVRAKNIIVRMPNWIGDLVMATPILADLRQAYPEASITAMAHEKVGSILEADPAIDELFLFSQSKGMLRHMGDRNVVEKLKNGKYDLGILLTNSFSSAWRFWQGKVKKRVGFRSDGRGFLLNYPVSFPLERKTQHLVFTYKRLLERCGVPCSETAPRLFLKEGESKKAWEMLKRFEISLDAKCIGIHPGAAYGSAKCWLPERFREVAKRLVEKNDSYVILFLGDAFQRPLINQICEGLPPRVLNLAGQTNLRMLMALISVCSAFLTNDSGPMHLADSLDTPLVALFGSTDPAITGPYRHSQAVMQRQVSCSPCFKRVCPIDFRCMKELSAQAVYERVLEVFQRKETISC